MLRKKMADGGEIRRALFGSFNSSFVSLARANLYVHSVCRGPARSSTYHTGGKKMHPSMYYYVLLACILVLAKLMPNNVSCHFLYLWGLQRYTLLVLL